MEMLGKKCPSCARKVKRAFSYCPYCGASFKVVRERKDFGMIGREDSEGHFQEDLKLPFGINGLVNSLVRQLEQMGGFGGEQPKGASGSIRIKVTAGSPRIKQIVRKEPNPEERENTQAIPKEKEKKWANLPKVEGKSKIRRLADRIIYEIKAPGVKTKEDVVLTRLASGLEIKAYSKDKCYVKFIPLTIDVLGYRVQKDKVFVEIRA